MLSSHVYLCMFEALVTRYDHHIVKYIMLGDSNILRIWLAVERLKWHLGVTYLLTYLLTYSMVQSPS